MWDTSYYIYLYQTCNNYVIKFNYLKLFYLWSPDLYSFTFFLQILLHLFFLCWQVWQYLNTPPIHLKKKKTKTEKEKFNQVMPCPIHRLVQWNNGKPCMFIAHWPDTNVCTFSKKEKMPCMYRLPRNTPTCSTKPSLRY